MQVTSIQPVFKLELNHKVIPNTVTIAKYDGIHPCLTAAVGYDKVIIHQPHGASNMGRARRSTAHGEVSELALSQRVVALAAGALRPGVTRDVLLVGSPTQILAYDFHDNSDLFYKEATDGVNVMVVGPYGQWTENIALVGGNSSLQALDWRGDELFWTVCSGKICSMILLDIDKNGENELVIGCEDSYIRVVRRGQVVQELAETGAVVQLAAAGDSRFAYALANGTIGIYDEGVRLWRVKSKQTAISVVWSGEALAACWSGGRVDWREGATGRMQCRVQLRTGGAAMLLADYRSQGVLDLVCVSDAGEVVGYPAHLDNAGAAFQASKKIPSEEDRIAITELFNKKQALLVELQHYEANSSGGQEMDKMVTAMPTNTRLQVGVGASVDEGCVELSISTNNETVVRAALVLAEGVFPEGETAAQHPPRAGLRPRLHMQLRPPRDVPVDVHVKALVGYADSEQYHIFELTKQLPKFSMYTASAVINRSTENGFVTFHITERVQRLCIWLNQNFLLEREIEPETEDAKELHMNLLGLRDKSNLSMDFESDGTMKISTPDIRLAGDVIQSLATFLNIADLQSTASFPEAENKLREEMTRASDLCETRSRLAAETAERAQLITALLPAAQDAAAYDLREMVNRYKEVVMLNEEILSGNHVRRSTHQQAADALSNLHGVLQYAARLRVGKYSKAVVTASRKAVKGNDTEALVKILQMGDS